MGLTPYELVYGKQVTLPIEIEIKTLRIELWSGMNLSDAHKGHLNQLNELEELRQYALQQATIV